MKSFGRLIKVLLIALAIPLFGFGISFFIIQDINQGLHADNMPDVGVICGAARVGELGSEAASELSDYCNEVRRIELLGDASILAASIGVSVPIIYWLASFYSGQNRKRIATVFPITLRFSILLIAVSVLLQGAVLTYAIYVGEIYSIGQFHAYVIGAIGFGALFGGVKLIVAAMKFGRKLTMFVAGVAIKADRNPQIFQFVKSLSDKLGAKVPDNIIVGLEPTFYVTSSQIVLPECEASLEGETLYISAPLSRLLSLEEFGSVIGHELGHFRGEDTTYSMRFAPVYAGLGQALTAVSSDEDEGAGSIAKLPAVAMLSYMYELFSTNEAKIGRGREHEADKAGVEAASAIALSVALVKLSIYSGVWETVQKQNIERLGEGKVANNLSVLFQNSAKIELGSESIDEILQSTLDEAISHPTDTHPPVTERLEALGVGTEKITKDMLKLPSDPAIQLIDDFIGVEQEVTLLEHKMMMAYGLVVPLDLEESLIYQEEVQD